MTTKAEWRERAKQAEARAETLALRVTALSLSPPLTFDNLMVCFPDKTVTYRGRRITVDTNCVSFPLTNDQNLLAPAGWYPIEESQE